MIERLCRAENARAETGMGSSSTLSSSSFSLRERRVSNPVVGGVVLFIYNSIEIGSLPCGSPNCGTFKLLPYSKAHRDDVDEARWSPVQSKEAVVIFNRSIKPASAVLSERHSTWVSLLSVCGEGARERIMVFQRELVICAYY